MSVVRCRVESMSPTREECLSEFADFLIEKAYEIAAAGGLPIDSESSSE